MDDFEQAWEKIVLGAERSTVLSDRDRRVVAYHEGGHALVAWLTPAADPVRKVSIVPHGRALGVTAQLPDEERYNMSRTDLLARLDVMLGGRASEALVIGEITTGAENDLVEATRLARRMITRWGMGQPRAGGVRLAGRAAVPRLSALAGSRLLRGDRRAYR